MVKLFLYDAGEIVVEVPILVTMSKIMVIYSFLIDLFMMKTWASTNFYWCRPTLILLPNRKSKPRNWLFVSGKRRGRERGLIEFPVNLGCTARVLLTILPLFPLSEESIWLMVSNWGPRPTASALYETRDVDFSLI